MTTTKVTGLTAFNVAALKQMADRVPTTELGKTFVVFPGTAIESAKIVQDAMSFRGATYGGRDTIYRSLVAVRNKLQGNGPQVTETLARDL